MMSYLAKYDDFAVVVAKMGIANSHDAEMRLEELEQLGIFIDMVRYIHREREYAERCGEECIIQPVYMVRFTKCTCQQAERFCRIMVRQGYMTALDGEKTNGRYQLNGRIMRDDDIKR